MIHRRRMQMSAMVMSLCLVAARGAAYVHPLSEESLREAYFFGRSTDADKLKKFLDQYVRRFPYPSKGPYVAEIEFRTPYEQVVLRSWQNSMGYSAQQALQDYSARRDVVVVRALIYFTATYPNTATDSTGQVVARPEDFWREFQFRFEQQSSIEPKKVSARSIYRRRGGLGGAEVFLEFDVSQFASGPLRIAVTKPDSQTIVAEFDLDQLK